MKKKVTALPKTHRQTHQGKIQTLIAPVTVAVTVKSRLNPLRLQSLKVTQ